MSGQPIEVGDRQEDQALEEQFTDFVIWMIVEARSQRENRGSVRFDPEKAAAFMQRTELYRKEQDEEWMRLSRRN